MIIYHNLKGEMARYGIIQSKLADELEINISTLNSKLSDPKRLKYYEALHIRNTFFPTMDISYLFATD